MSVIAQVVFECRLSYFKGIDLVVIIRLRRLRFHQDSINLALIPPPHVPYRTQLAQLPPSKTFL